MKIIIIIFCLMLLGCSNLPRKESREIIAITPSIIVVKDNICDSYLFYKRNPEQDLKRE